MNPTCLVLKEQEHRSLLESVKTVRTIDGTDISPGFTDIHQELFEIRLNATIEEEIYERNRPTASS